MKRRKLALEHDLGSKIYTSSDNKIAGVYEREVRPAKTACRSSLYLDLGDSLLTMTGIPPLSVVLCFP